MDPTWLAIAELVLVLGGGLAFAVWQIMSIRRLRRETKDRSDRE